MTDRDVSPDCGGDTVAAPTMTQCGVGAEADASTTLRGELLALVMLADIQAIPERAGTVALDFDHHCLSILSAFQDELTVRQRALLNALDGYFDELSRQGDEALWSEAAIRDSLEWSDIRGLARQALDAFGWPAPDLPPE